MRVEVEQTITEILVREVGADANRFELRAISLVQTQQEAVPDRAAKVSAIIAAYNEEDTIVEVIRAVEGHPLVDEIIVVDDGSADATSERARTTLAKVITLEVNQGKAGAMSTGVRAARNNTILFLDADILGLTHEIITLTVTPVLTKRCGMFVAIRARRTYWMNKLLYFIPVLGGERALTKDLWRMVPRMYRKGFQIEIALNYYTKKSGQKMAFGVMPGLSQVIKEKKRGFWLGMWQRIKMCGEVLWISFRLYVIRTLIDLFRGATRERPNSARQLARAARP
ncbi:MAG TPA: glycosyltransferase family 2 protein [Candidatus Limnocylindria bacterium]|nr:glycosyltransferase family 2 protein [Candidatus Limnocylindria bacterium]